MDKNGNWKVILNASVQLNVETLPNKWEPARHIYATVQFKFKTKTDRTNPFNKKLIIVPKNIEITKIKVMKGDQVQDMEQMMLQSMTNVYLE